MALPANVGTGWVTGLFMDNSGGLLSGTITFTASPPKILDATSAPPTTILPGPVTVTLSAGTFLKELVATDDADLNPFGFTYLVSFALKSGSTSLAVDSFSISVPAGSSGSAVDLTVASPVPVNTGTPIITWPTYFAAPTGGDDLAALTAALTALGAQGGELRLRPDSTYLVSNTLEVPNKVTISGDGRSAATIKAHSSFPTSGVPLVRLGPASGQSFGSRLERLTLDCNSIAGSIGAYGHGCQEMCGLSYVTVQNFADIGIHMDTGCANYGINDVELYPRVAGANKGLHANGNAGQNLIQRVTAGVNGHLTIGIHVNGGSAVVVGLHVENCTDGILFAAGANGMVNGVSGPTVSANVTSLVRSDSSTRYTDAANITLNSATNAWKDDFQAITCTDAFVQHATLGDGYVARLHHYGDKLGFFNTAPVVKGASLTATASAAPAGGTGATAGAYDTAAHRDAMIATLNTTVTRLNDLVSRLQAYGLIP